MLKQSLAVIALSFCSFSAMATSALPSAGMLMNQVLAKYGAPTEKQAPIGKPPISVWRYADFNVYFEHQHVVHSVRLTTMPASLEIIVEPQRPTLDYFSELP
ncbi:MAG: hypothetical protein VXW65_00775 [Pseudomonadota bacterium]|nr:hypothetical protein [Pseudomonadota bacterium]